MGYIHETNSNASWRREEQTVAERNHAMMTEYKSLRKTCATQDDVIRLFELVNGINATNWVAPWRSPEALWVEILIDDEEDGWVRGEMYRVTHCSRDEDNDVIIECTNQEGSCTLCACEDCLNEMWKVL